MRVRRPSYDKENTEWMQGKLGIWYCPRLVSLSPDRSSLVNSADPDLHPDFHSAYGFTLFLIQQWNSWCWNFEMDSEINIFSKSSYSENIA